jgi:LysM repeat protein
MKKNNRFLFAVIITALSFIVVIASLVFAISRINLSSTFQNTSTPQLAFVVTDTPIMSITPTATSTINQPTGTTPTHTQTEPISISPTFTPGHTQTNPTLSRCQAPRGWVLVFINQSDTLETIAKKYHTTVDILLLANCLSSTDTSSGTPIYVPPAPAEKTSLTTTPKAVQCGPPNNWTTYQVRKGDNLYRIGLSYQITVKDLQQANCMGSSTLIRTGDWLFVPNIPTIIPSTTRTGTPTP